MTNGTVLEQIVTSALVPIFSETQWALIIVLFFFALMLFLRLDLGTILLFIVPVVLVIVPSFLAFGFAAYVIYIIIVLFIAWGVLSVIKIGQ